MFSNLIEVLQRAFIRNDRNILWKENKEIDFTFDKAFYNSALCYTDIRRYFCKNLIFFLQDLSQTEIFLF